ncbi:MAG TPA: hypothetical protein VMU03_02920 [Gammaproteobacteria bacterium]|nr:hypothetical protein [Gammaproteobacteria bacterium]
MSAAERSSRRPSFGASLVAGFLLSVCGAVVLAALGPLVGPGTALRAVIALVAFAYVLYLVARSGERAGRIATLACWLVAALGTLVAGLPFPVYVLVHVGLVWLVRSLYYYSGVLPALADLGVSVLGAAFAVWAAQRSGSAWLSFWCFFLAQAFHVLIPAGLMGRAPHDGDAHDAFNRAQRTAEEAIRRLSTAR